MRKLLITSLFSVLPSYAAAVLSISACSANTGGTTITCTVSGGAAVNLTPTTGITGFTPHLTLTAQGSQIATTNVTASGTGATGSVVVTLTATVWTGETVTLDWSGGNLTDGTNTPVGQNGVAVTNSSTQTGTILSLSTPNVYQYGRFITSNCYTRTGCTTFQGYYSLLEFQFTANASTVISFNLGDSSNFDVSVDDGGLTAVTVGLTAQDFTWSGSIAVGAGSHNIKLTNRNGTSFVDGNNTVRISSPTGATCCTSINDNTGSTYVVGTAPFTNSSRSENSFLGTDSQQNYANCLFWSGGLGNIRFNASGVSWIDVWVYNGSKPFALYMDGVIQGSTTSTAGGTRWARLRLGSSLDTGSHLWEIVGVGDPMYIYQVILPSGASLGSQPAARGLLTIYGDSIADGVGSSGHPNDIRNMDIWFYSRNQNYSYYSAGNPGAGVSTCASCTGGSNYLMNNTAQISTRTAPNIVILNGGVNDEIFGGNALPPAAFITDYTTMITNAANRMQAGGRIYIRAILPYTSTNSVNILSWRAAQAQAVINYNTAKVNGVTAIYFDITSTVSFNPTAGQDTADGTHPNNSGYLKVGNFEYDLIFNSSCCTTACWSCRQPRIFKQ